MTLADSINTLFFTDGVFSWVALLIVIVLLLSIVMFKKYLIALALPVTVLVGLLYLSEDLGWHFLIMVLNSVFLLLEYSAKRGGD